MVANQRFDGNQSHTPEVTLPNASVVSFAKARRDDMWDCCPTREARLAGTELNAREALDRVATEVGGAVGSGSGGPDDVVLTSSLDGLEVQATIAPGSKGAGMVTVEAPAPGTGELELELFPEGFTHQFAKMFGAQDIQVGESRFDERYMIKASDESLAKLWLTFDLRKLIHASHPESAKGAFLVELANERARITWAPSNQNPKRIESAMRAVALLGGRARALLTEEREMASSLGGSLIATGDAWRPGDEVGVEVEQGGVIVRLEHHTLALEDKHPEVYLRLSAPADRAGRVFICRPNAHKRAEKLLGVDVPEISTHDREVGFHFTVGAAPQGVLEGRLRGDERAALLEALPTAVTVADGRVDVYLKGFAPSIRRLKRGCELAVALAGEPEEVRVESRSRETTEKPRSEKSRRGGQGRPVSRARTAPESLGDTWCLTGLAVDDDAGHESSLNVTVDGVDIYAAEHFSYVDQTPITTLSMRASVPNSTGLTLRLVEGDLDPVSSMLGAQDVEIGAKPFDDHFIIKTTDPGYAALWISEAVQKYLLGVRDANIISGYQINIKNNRLKLYRGGKERSPRRLESAFRAVAALCNRSEQIAEELRRLANELDADVLGNPRAWHPDTGITLTIGRGESAVTIGQQRSDDFSKKPLLMTTVRKPRLDTAGGRFVVAKHDLKKRALKKVDGKFDTFKTDDPQFNFLYWAGCEDEGSLRECLDEQMISRLVLSEPEVMIVGETEIDIWFAGLVLKAERLARMLKVLGGLGGSVDLSGPAGPYR